MCVVYVLCVDVVYVSYALVVCPYCYAFVCVVYCLFYLLVVPWRSQICSSRARGTCVQRAQRLLGTVIVHECCTMFHLSEPKPCAMLHLLMPLGHEYLNVVNI